MKRILLAALLILAITVPFAVAAPKPVGTNPVLVYCIDATTGDWFQADQVKGITFRGRGVPDTSTSMLVLAPEGEQTVRVSEFGYTTQLVTVVVTSSMTKVQVLMFPL